MPYLGAIGRCPGDNTELINRLIEELAADMGPLDRELRSRFGRPTVPPLFVLGVPRSGTTALMWLLQASGMFAVPTNLMARLSFAPYIAAKIQRLLFEDEAHVGIGSGQDATDNYFSSDRGRTQGLLSPNEFFHFWRRYIPIIEPGYLCKEQLAGVDIDGVLSAISSMEHVFGKPFASKAMMMQFNLDFFAPRIGDAVFLYLQRDARYTMQSILRAREKTHGSRNIWWSVKPKNYLDLTSKDCFHQVAGQVWMTQQSIEQGLSSVREAYKVRINYEDLCSDPLSVLDAVSEVYSGIGVRTEGRREAKIRLRLSNEQILSDEDMRALERAYEDMQSGQK